MTVVTDAAHVGQADIDQGIIAATDIAHAEVADIIVQEIEVGIDIYDVDHPQEKKEDINHQVLQKKDLEN